MVEARGHARPESKMAPILAGAWGHACLKMKKALRLAGARGHTRSEWKERQELVLAGAQSHTRSVQKSLRCQAGAQCIERVEQPPEQSHIQL